MTSPRAANPDPPNRAVPPSVAVPRRGRAVAIAAWLYLACAATAWVVVARGDAWWPGTLLMFSPLWWLSVPGVALVLLTLWVRRRAVLPALAGLVVAGGPVSGFNVPSVLDDSAPAGRTRVRVMTWNVHYADPGVNRIDALLRETGADVAVLQEWRAPRPLSPGWAATHQLSPNSAHSIVSRYPIIRATHHGENSAKEEGSVAEYVLDTPDGPFTLFSVHLASPRSALWETYRGHRGGPGQLDENSELRRVQSKRVAALAAAASGPVVVAGDLNTPARSVLFRQVWGGYTDAFSAAGRGWGYTFLANRTAVRIDHVLLGPGLRCVKCWVGPERGSPHRPVIADIILPPG